MALRPRQLWCVWRSPLRFLFCDCDGKRKGEDLVERKEPQ